MNKFFRLVSMFAIAGVTFAYTSCTDYSEDINKVDGRVDNLQSQFDAFKSATDESIKKIDGLIADLQKTVATLETKEDHKKDVDALNKLIDGLKSDATALAGRVTAIEEDLPNYVKKTDFDETLKGYVKVGEFNTKIGEITGRLDAIEGKLNPLAAKYDSELKISEIISKIDAVKATADDASQKVGVLRTDVDVLQKALKGYTSEGAVSAKFDAIDEEVAKKLNIADFKAKFDEYFQGEFDEAFKEAIRISCAKDGEVDKAIYAALNPAVEALETKISNLNERIDAVLGIIADRLSSIALVPQYYYDGVPAILFETIAYNPLADDKENEKAVAPEYRGDQNSWLVNQFKNYTSAESVAQFRLNPRTVGVDCADFSLVGDKADYVITRAAAPAAPVSIVGTPTCDPKTGYATFKVKKNEKINTDKNDNKNLDIVALKAVLKKGLTDAEKKADAKPEVYSEFVHVNEIAYTADQLAISDKDALAQYAKDKKTAHEYAKTFEAAAAQDPVYEMPYNSKYFDLKALVATCINTNITTPGLEATQDHANLDLVKYGLTYKFSVAQTDYVIPSYETETNQQTVIECVDAKNGLYKVKAANNAEFNKEAIGRTPIVRVDLMHNGNIVTRAFIKLVITVTKAPDLPVPTPAKNIVLSCPQTKVDFVVSEEDMRREVYRVLNISHEEFWNTYDLGDRNVTINGKYATFTKPELLSGVGVDGTATKKVVWNFTHGEVGKIEGGKTVVGTLVLVNKLASSPLPKHVVFTFTANFTLPAVAIDVTRNEIFWKDNMYQVNVNVPETKDADAEKCQFDNKMYTANAIGEQAWKNFVVKNVPCNETGKFVIAYVKENGEKIPYDKSSKGIYLVTVDDVTYIRLNKADNNVKAALNSANGLQAELKYEITYKSGDVVYPKEGEVVVNFIRPLNLNMPEGLSVKDAVTGGDKVDFNHTNLLTDWRGEAVLADVEVPVTKNWYEWVKVCGQNDDHKLQWIPDTQVIETPAQLEVDYQTITIPTGGVYFSATVQLYDYRHGWVKARSYTAKGRSAAESIQNALTIAKSKEPGHYFDSVDWNHKYEIENIKEDTTSETIEFQSVKTVNYIPAKYKTIPGYWAYADCTDMPAVNGDYAGQTVGCYKWTLKSAPDTKVVPGQYWNYYGPISEVTLDVKNVKTNLPDEKLPAKASLVQTGTTVTYMNVESPINSDYKLFIPAKVTYGWGTINATLEIDVKKL